MKNIFEIPNLPVPNLEETLSKFLEWVEPIISDKDFAIAKNEVKEFINDPNSKKIQDILLKRSEDKNNSWLSDWWMKYIYLSSRGPVTPECNAPMEFYHPNITKYNVIENMAIIAYKLSEVYLNYKINGIPDYPFGKVKMSMDQIKGFFTSIREPNILFDDYYIEENIVEHIILLKNNVHYKIPVIKNKKMISISDIKKSIETIINEEKDSIEYNANLISADTSRDHSKKIFDDLLKNNKNKEAYKTIREAIMMFSYDDEEIEDSILIMKNVLSAKNFNRWHGKSTSLVFNKNNKIGFISDHSFVDGGTEITIFNELYKFYNEDIEFANSESSNNYEKINFEISADIESELKTIKENFIKYLANVNIKKIWMDNIKTNEMRELGILSPDAFFQLGYQIAQYRTNKTLRNTYIAVDLRNFFRGRTECVRPISLESKQFVIDLCEGKVTDKAKAKEQLKAIYDVHYQRTKDCKMGHGINRHMLGLTLAYEENKESLGEKPKLFDTVAWKDISANPISTSSIAHPGIKLAYFDPVHADGIGIFYAGSNDGFIATISAWDKDKDYQEKFVNNCKQALNDLIEIYK